MKIKLNKLEREIITISLLDHLEKVKSLINKEQKNIIDNLLFKLKTTTIEDKLIIWLKCKKNERNN